MTTPVVLFYSSLNTFLVMPPERTRRQLFPAPTESILQGLILHGSWFLMRACGKTLAVRPNARTCASTAAGLGLSI